MSTTATTAAPSLRELALGDLNHEMNTTRRLLERVPDAHLDWKPHGKSMTLGGLALHVATLPSWMTHTLQNDFFDIVSVTRNAPPSGVQQILDAFEATSRALRQALDEAGDEALMRPWQLRRGEQVLMTMPRAAMLRGFGLNHIIHHRAQLSVYLRLLDVPLPPMYGPTADEQPSFG
ncbi:MAG: DinB family protein [Gemmatimonadetes bacterium]|nr:DinB family protein [Gemmatimonadota bacterium]